MGKWGMVRLGDIGESFIGLTYKPENIVDDGIIVLRSGNVQNNATDLTDIVRVDKVPKNKLLVRDGDILMCSRNGSANLVGKSTMISNLPENMTFGAFMMIYRSKSNPYITHFFHSPYFKRQLTKSATTTINQITKSMLDEVKIPLPPLDEQKRIAKNLDLASEIVKGYKEQIAELDKLVQSVFYEMFGDPVTNSKKFRIKQGKDFFKLSSGKPVPPEERFETGIPAYGGNGISWYTDNILFEQDTLIVGRVGFQSGNVRLAEGPLWVTDNAMYMSEYQSSEYNLDFLCVLMKHIDFTRFQDAGDLKKITQKPFMQMRFISPPLPLQTRFAAIVTEIEAQKAQVQQALTEAENLFNSLMQEYFE